MSWRRVVACCGLAVAIGCAPGADDAKAPDGRQAHGAAVEVPPCDTTTSATLLRSHLGDGTTTDHYYPIVDYLRENPGSESTTRALEHEEREAAQSPHDLKPPSSGIGETEFSHLLGAIARDNGGIGAAVFDTTGLTLGAAGLDLEELVLPADRMALLRKASGDAPVEVRYTCHELGELIHVEDCKGPITAYYRPVIDYARDSRLLGFSMLVVRNEPPCKDARQ